MPLRLKVWREASRKREVSGFKIKKDKGMISVKFDFYLPPVEAYHSIDYSIFADGIILISNNFRL